jgi:hypothetical protein
MLSLGKVWSTRVNPINTVSFGLTETKLKVAFMDSKGNIYSVDSCTIEELVEGIMVLSDELLK